MKRIVESFYIVLMCVLAAIVYGIIHDQITARICIEYFTMGHPRLNWIESDSPTMLGLAWGILATWWVGLILGIGLAVAAQAGSLPRLSLESLLVPVAKLMASCAIVAMLAGVIGYELSVAEVIRLDASLANRMSTQAHHGFVADLFAHNASYGVGFLGGLIVMAKVIRMRYSIIKQSRRL